MLKGRAYNGNKIEQEKPMFENKKVQMYKSLRVYAGFLYDFGGAFCLCSIFSAYLSDTVIPFSKRFLQEY